MKKEEMSDKEYFEEEAASADLRFSHSIRAYLPQIMPFLLLSICSVYALLNVKGSVTYGVLLKISYLTPIVTTCSLIYLFIAYKLSHGREKLLVFFILGLGAAATGAYLYQDLTIPSHYLSYYLISCLSIGCLGTLYFIMYSRSAYVTINERNLVIYEGIFTRIEDTTDLSEVKDKDLHRTFFDVLLGLARIEIDLARSMKLQIVIKNMRHRDISQLLAYLKSHSFPTYREWRMAQERRKAKKKEAESRGSDIISDEDEFDEFEKFDDIEGDGE